MARYGRASQTIWNRFDVGKGISDMVIDQLLKDGTLRVIDRQMLDKLMQEQKFLQFRPRRSVDCREMGKLSGIDTMVVGDVTQFGSRRP